jgi:DNA gyrase/topoisomerase IV subunit A
MSSGKLRDQDALEDLLTCRAHDTLLLLNTGARVCVCVCVARGGHLKLPGSCYHPLHRGNHLAPLLTINMHACASLLNFFNPAATAGRAYTIKAHKVPEASRTAMGSAIAEVCVWW